MRGRPAPIVQRRSSSRPIPTRPPRSTASCRTSSREAPAICFPSCPTNTTRRRIPPTSERFTSSSFAERRSPCSAVAHSEAMRHVFRLLEVAARKDVTVLLEGESGTGKEVLASAIHEESPRKDGPFVVIDCGAIPANLVESELFGHERGAFTGAVAADDGAF